MKINTKKFALSTGVAYGTAIAWIVLFGGVFGLRQAGGSPELALLVTNTYPGLEISMKGVLLTFLWGVVDGALLGLIAGGVYNLLSGSEHECACNHDDDHDCACH